MENLNNTPTLRFPVFTGEWEEKKLGEIGDIITGNTPTTSNEEFYNGEYHFVSPFDINEKRFFEKTKTTLTKLGFSKGRKIRAGSSLFVCIGSTIGKVAQNKIDCITNQQINSIVPSEDFNDDFVFSLLENHSSKIKMLAAEQAVPIINKTTFSKYIVLIPSLPEQTKIASFLTAVDDKLSSLKKKKQLLEQYKKGVMQQIFSQQLRFKDDNGEDFAEWEEKKLGEVCELLHGYQFKTNDFTKDGLAIVKISNVIGANLYLDDITYIDSTRYNEFSKFEIFNGDILMSLTGNIGRVIEVKNKPFRLIQNYRVGKFCPYNEKLLSKQFLKYLLISDLVFGRFNQLSNQSAQANFGKQDMDKITVFIPNISEQTKIANFLSAIDEKISHCCVQIEKMEGWKKGLLQGMFI